MKIRKSQIHIITITVCLCNLFLNSWAQDKEPTQEYFPRKEMMTLSYSHEAKSDFKDDDGAGSAEMTDVAMNLTLPLHLAEKWRLISGLSLQWYHFNFTGISQSDQDTYVIAIPFRTIINISEKWTFLGVLAPSIYSDLKQLSKEPFKASAVAIGMYKYSPKLTMSIGTVYSRIFGVDKLFPALGCSWTPTPQWKIDAMFPRPFIAYAPSLDLRFFTYLTPAGSEWNIQHTVDGDEQDCTFRFKGYRAGIGLEFDIQKHLSLFVSGGIAFKRDYELKDEHDTTFVEDEVEDTWFSQIALQVR